MSVWQNMLSRCRKPEDKAYKNYGARGIRVEWESFEVFYADMGPPPPGLWLERKDNDGPYSRANCAWVSPGENQLNKRTSKRWTIGNLTFASSVAAAHALGVSPSVVVRGCNGYYRLGRWHAPRAGWSCAS